MSAAPRARARAACPAGLLALKMNASHASRMLEGCQPPELLPLNSGNGLNAYNDRTTFADGNLSMCILLSRKLSEAYKSALSTTQGSSAAAVAAAAGTAHYPRSLPADGGASLLRGSIFACLRRFDGTELRSYSEADGTMHHIRLSQDLFSYKLEESPPPWALEGIVGTSPSASASLSAAAALTERGTRLTLRVSISRRVIPASKDFAKFLAPLVFVFIIGTPRGGEGGARQKSSPRPPSSPARTSRHCLMTSGAQRSTGRTTRASQLQATQP